MSADRRAVPAPPEHEAAEVRSNRTVASQQLSMAVRRPGQC